MKRINNKWWIGAAAAVALTAIVGVGAVMAQEESPTAPDAATGTATGTQAAQQAPSANEMPSSGATPEAGADDGADEMPRAGGCGGHFVDKAALAEFLGVTEEQLRTELQAEGATLASVAAAHGQSRDALKAFLTEQAQTRLAEKVAEGDLTQAEADAKLSGFTANLDAMIDGLLPMGRGFHGRFGAPDDGGTDGSNGSSGTYSRDASRS